jgi:hypothetical protein
MNTIKGQIILDSALLTWTIMSQQQTINTVQFVIHMQILNASKDEVSVA